MQILEHMVGARERRVPRQIREDRVHFGGDAAAALRGAAAADRHEMSTA